MITVILGTRKGTKIAFVGEEYEGVDDPGSSAADMIMALNYEGQEDMARLQERYVVDEVWVEDVIAGGVGGFKGR